MVLNKNLAKFHDILQWLVGYITGYVISYHDLTKIRDMI